MVVKEQSLICPMKSMHDHKFVLSFFLVKPSREPKNEDPVSDINQRGVNLLVLKGFSRVPRSAQVWFCVFKAKQ